MLEEAVEEVAAQLSISVDRCSSLVRLCVLNHHCFELP